MTSLLDQAIARLRALPEDRREAAAHGVLQYIEALEVDADSVLTPDELDEIDAQLADPDDNLASDEEVEAVFGRKSL
jgi:hypothetical protein